MRRTPQAQADGRHLEPFHQSVNLELDIVKADEPLAGPQTYEEAQPADTRKVNYRHLESQPPLWPPPPYSIYYTATLANTQTLYHSRDELVRLLSLTIDILLTSSETHATLPHFHQARPPCKL